MPRLWPHALFLALAVALAACDSLNPQKQREEELARNTFACLFNGERFVVRFAEGEARVLLAGQRINLYQIPVGSTGSLVRYSNGSMELRGRGTELTFIVDGAPTVLQNCEPYALLPTPGAKPGQQ
jgi:hypothetical protein